MGEQRESGEGRRLIKFMRARYLSLSVGFDLEILILDKHHAHSSTLNVPTLAETVAMYIAGWKLKMNCLGFECLPSY
jgi:hypothetical protein